MTYHEKRRQEMIEAEERLGNREGTFYDWVEETKFDEWSTIKDRAEDDLGYYVENNFVELVDEYLKQL